MLSVKLSLQKQPKELFEAIHPPREEPLSGDLVCMMTA
jgi:hypothetical protein